MTIAEDTEQIECHCIQRVDFIPIEQVRFHYVSPRRHPSSHIPLVACMVVFFVFPVFARLRVLAVFLSMCLLATFFFGLLGQCPQFSPSLGQGVLLLAGDIFSGEVP